MSNSTPLRYPGGKSLMTPLLKNIIDKNFFGKVIYAEPFAGGAGAAINLLLDGTVSSIMLNDACTGIYSFWYYLVNQSDAFMDLFENTLVNLDEWHKYREIFVNEKKPSLKLGFATFFLSRCNRSGILYAGPIGGKKQESQDKADYKIDCRFNKPALKDKLKKIIEHKENIEVYNDDAIDFLCKITKVRNTLVYIDPPYYEKGKELYLNYYNADDHTKLLKKIRAKYGMRWLLSYDNVKEIRKLYKKYNLYSFDLCYTVQKVKIGSELLTHSKKLIMPDPFIIKRSSKDVVIEKIK